MDKREVVICTGTACYVLGGANLLLLENMLPDELREQVSIVGSPCLGLCRSDLRERPPFVKVDGRIIAEASVQKILDALAGGK